MRIDMEKWCDVEISGGALNSEFFIVLSAKGKGSKLFRFPDLEPIDFEVKDEVLLEIFLFLLYEGIDAGTMDYARYCEVYGFDDSSEKTMVKWDKMIERLRDLNGFGFSLDDIMEIYDFYVIKKMHKGESGDKLKTNV
jgi:hypothetical protein